MKAKERNADQNLKDRANTVKWLRSKSVDFINTDVNCEADYPFTEEFQLCVYVKGQDSAKKTFPHAATQYEKAVGGQGTMDMFGTEKPRADLRSSFMKCPM